MSKTWPAQKPRLLAALIDAFDEDRFAQMLELKCQHKLSHLTADRIAFPQKVFEVIGIAEHDGWLEELVEAARNTNNSHSKLQRVTTEIMTSVAAEGKHFYQQVVIAKEARITEELVLIRQLHPYLETLFRNTRSVPLTGLDESGEMGKELKLSQLFVALQMGEKLVDFWEPGDGKGILTDAIGHIHAEPRLILLGDPGSGKSTLLRYISHCLAGMALHPGDPARQEFLSWPVLGKVDQNEITQTRLWPDSISVPVYIELRNFARQSFDKDDNTAIIDYVCQQFQSEDLGDLVDPLRKLARRGHIVFLLDGVDEVPVQERADVWKVISSLEKGVYGGNRWVATCRVLSYDKKEAPDGVPFQQIQPLDDNQMFQFINNWYGGLFESGQLNREQATGKINELKAAVQRPELGELASNPMLLSIMALVQTFRGALLNDRAMLYQACVETLLLRWQLRLEQGEESEIPDALRSLGVNPQDVERLLWEIAWEAHSKAEDRTRSADIPYWDVMRIATEHLGSPGKAEQFLDYTEKRAHLLVGHGGRQERVYRFPHRTFQEYLAACRLASQRRFKRRVKDLAIESDMWREVLNLAVGTLAFNQQNREKAFDGIEEMIPTRLPVRNDVVGWRRIWLAGEMCATVGRQAAERDEVGQELLPELRDQLVALLEHEALTPQQRVEAGDALGKLGDPRPGVCTLEPDLIQIPAGDFQYGDEKEVRTIDQPFAIARYPVTVAQFGHFVEDGGYEDPSFWGGTDSAAWRWRVSEHPDDRGKEPVTQPEYWKQARWHGANRPIVGESWYEAQAYCAWLTAKSGRTYRLPTEEEWERAARHTDGRDWSWGNEWRDGIINSEEAGINRMSAVGAFPSGAAVCGALDMCGSIWGWTISLYDEDLETYVVRGGSWRSSGVYARVAHRDWGLPNLSYVSVGFRLVSPVL